MSKRIISLLLCIIFIVLCFTSCGKNDEELIKDTINDFLKAYNAGDLDATIETFSYKQRTNIKSYINFIDGLGLGVALSTLFGISGDIISDNGEDMLKIRISDIDIDEDEESATVEVDAIFGTKYSYENYEGDFDMVKEDDGWYIEDINLSPIEQTDY